MNNRNQLYQKILEMDHRDMNQIEAEFFMEFDKNDPRNRLPWITAFLTMSTWFGTAMRSGVWTFYETANMEDMKTTIQFLRVSGENELADMFEKGIHDYQNPQYTQTCDYPEEWLEEAEEIDGWISEHEDDLWKWEYDTLIRNKDSVLT